MYSAMSEGKLNRTVSVDNENTPYSVVAHAAALRQNYALVHRVAIDIGAGSFRICAWRG